MQMKPLDPAFYMQQQLRLADDGPVMLVNLLPLMLRSKPSSSKHGPSTPLI